MSNYNCICTDKNGFQKSITTVDKCDKCDDHCNELGDDISVTCTPYADLSKVIPIVIVIFVVIVLLIIGYYALWFFALKTTINKIESSTSSIGKNGITKTMLVILILLIGISTFFSPLSGISILILLFILWFYSRHK